MSLFGSRRSGVNESGSGIGLSKVMNAEGVKFASGAPGIWVTRDLKKLGADEPLAAFLLQLEDEGFAEVQGDHLFLAWKSVYEVCETPDHAASFGMLQLPPIEEWKPTITSAGTLTDTAFTVHIANWRKPDGSRPKGDVYVEGALLRCEGRAALLPRPVWEAMEAVFSFRRSQASGATDQTSNKQGVALVRARALSAGIELTDFLAKTVVLTPEKLQIRLRKAPVLTSKVVEVIPGFEGQPRRWIEIFDRIGDVQDRYEIPDGEGMTHVLVSAAVKTVLSEIKRMPGRRVAGDRAEAFIRNPFAALGPEASEVIEPSQFEQARDDAGISFSRFTAHVARDSAGYPFEVGLLIEEMAGGEVRTDRVIFQGGGEISQFLQKLDARIAAGAECCHWNGFDLEILGDTPAQAEVLRLALVDIERPQGFKASEVLDLSRYSERIEGFGVEKPYYSPFIARKSDDAGWFPDNVELGVLYTPEGGGETIAISLNGDNMEAFKEALARAKDKGADTFQFPGCPKPIPVKWAEDALGILSQADQDVRKGTFDPNKVKDKGRATSRKGLVVKPNVDNLDYEERRGALALAKGVVAPSPKKLLPDVSLKDHQKEGVAWLLHLWSRSPAECRGALLADDMGLGKTLQLLAFMALVLEQDQNAAPFLVVAPVSLLENWSDEIERFFEPNTFKLLTLYGDALASKRLPKAAVDEELKAEGITRLLKRDWLGGANLVLTTYETLRDLEFSLGAQKWSAVICDEAQKIKNPNAMVTRAAKKQNARFKIACTGTPVENTLTDIWCLFDYLQPGLLGALKDFGERYRKPIEAETEEEKAKVEELRTIIEPQILRRTKAEVAKDLPQKIEVPECRSLQISDRQRALYADAVGAFKNRSGAGGISSHLGLIQYLRRLCSDPRSPGALSTDAIPIAEIERHSPKMAWLLRTLADIKRKDDKAIVFCEFRDLQRTLQRAISEKFGIVPDIINGDTSASSKSANSRQKRIKAFQESRGFGVIILSPLAVGFGVNIQAANHVIHFTRTWNPAKEDQATDRAYRIGQTRDVYVYYPVIVAQDFLTFDAKLDTLLDWKRGLSTDMLNGTGELSPAEFGDLGSPGGGSAFGNELLTPDDIGSLEADAFEAFCALLWSKMGYKKTMRTPQSGDGGVDVIAISGMGGVLIQCKSSTVDGRELGWEAVKDVVAGAAAYSSRFDGVTFSLVAATNQKFNGTAKAQAAINHVELVDFQVLAQKLAEFPIKQSELTSFLFSQWD